MNLGLKKDLIWLLKSVGLYTTFKVPEAIEKKFRSLDDHQIKELQTSLEKNYFPSLYPDGNIDPVDLKAHITGRTTEFRTQHIPFLSSIVALEGKKILEIGCGTGSSTIAFLEQGANVCGLDVDEGSLKVATRRCELYRLEAKFRDGNAKDIQQLFAGEQFDIIIFFASLEHMTHEERLRSMRGAWNMLLPGGYWCIFDSPNRLWNFDVHTSLLPFYYWLPDELAFDYSQFSPRPGFKEEYKKKFEDERVSLARWGRGISYHEFNLSIKDVTTLNVKGSLNDFLRRYSFLQRISYHRSDEFKYKHILQKIGPKNLHPAFYESYLDLVIQKD